ncbi:MAG: hypothetical protein HYZ34_07060 [Ignavibacteriae bacterium]|nr:hypothetical protein [Ignavibacteriota bacterium]
MEKYCPNCRLILNDPGRNDMLKHARYWRDNKCYICDTTLIIPNNTQQNSFATVSKETTSKTQNRKRIIWGLILFFAVLISIKYFASTIENLKVTVRCLKNDDSSVLWITNEESVTIKLIKVEINGNYTLDSFPDTSDTYMIKNLIGRGK